MTDFAFAAGVFIAFTMLVLVVTAVLGVLLVALTDWIRAKLWPRMPRAFTVTLTTTPPVTWRDGDQLIDSDGRKYTYRWNDKNENTWIFGPLP